MGPKPFDELTLSVPYFDAIDQRRWLVSWGRTFVGSCWNQATAGLTPGARSNTPIESALVLDIAERLEARLENETGIKMVLTRPQDESLSLRTRTELAHSMGTDLF
ncbi:MAG: N-acetylmuramoyl-L-alanine amidase [Acidobacteriota bacterium]|nr:N-acetylmuramoyl-L-alanine amidase [Acidobacteriota bacterium]